MIYEQSMNTVLHQEILRYNKLLETVSTTLLELRSALKGEILLSEEIEQLGHQIEQNQFPSLWKSVSFTSLKPLGSWIKNLLERIDFYNNWINNGYPPVYWISGFFFPQSFLTGILQVNL